MMATITISTTSIVKGPSREDMFDSLRLCAEHRTVILELRDRAQYKVKAGVVMLKPEDGSGNNWLIEVYINVNSKSQVVPGYYNTATRTGHLHIK